MEWTQLIDAALGGGLVVKLLNIAYSERRRKSDHSDLARRFVDEHLDQFLKSADELVGKLCSLAREDFKSIRMLPANPN